MKKYFFSLVILLIFLSCQKDQKQEMIPDIAEDLTHIPFDPQKYPVEIPTGFPSLVMPPESITQEGVLLGRHLFYDPILSLDSTVACASCHDQSNGFADLQTFSSGVGGLLGKRNAPSILNVGFFNKGLFWDGRAENLNDQAEVPVVDPHEMANDWDLLIPKLIKHPEYPRLFRKAFGIERSDEITRDFMTNAIAQFESTLISSNARYDSIWRLQITFPTEDELNGLLMFFDHPAELPDAECGHCHNGPLLTNLSYFNNGLDPHEDPDSFSDPGLGGFTKNTLDYGKFKTPSLRNIALTPPYMHDGRFETLEEVIEFYNKGEHGNVKGVDVNIHPLNLTDEQKKQLIAFLHTLTDTTVINNPDYNNPFD